MSIDASTLDDIDSQTTLQFYDSSEISWNGRTLELLSDSLQSCLEALSLQFPSMPQALSAKPIVLLHIDSAVTTATHPISTPSIEPT